MEGGVGGGLPKSTGRIGVKRWGASDLGRRKKGGEPKRQEESGRKEKRFFCRRGK